MQYYSHYRMNNNDKIAPIKISWENFPSYCSFGSIFVVENLNLHIIQSMDVENFII